MESWSHLTPEQLVKALLAPDASIPLRRWAREHRYMQLKVADWLKAQEAPKET